MKNFKLSKKLKTLLWTSSALVLNTVIASSLTSCSLFKKDVINDIGGYDKQYGITHATYDKMENDFKEIYETDLETKHKQGEINDDQHESNLSSFRSSLNNFHDALYSDYKTYSYTIKTSALKDFAKDNYGIRLARYTGANLDNEISQIKNSMLVNLTMMINEYGVEITTAQDLIKNANKQFDDCVKDITSDDDLKNDVVAAVQYLQNNMIGCFDGVCKEMDVIITQKKLSGFLNNVTIDVKDEVLKGKEYYYFDELKYGAKQYKKDTIISENDYNNIFDIDVKDDIPNLKSSLNDESSKTIEYSEDMITGYTLKPIVYDMVEDPIKNEYNIEVDFTLVNDRYKNDKDVAKLTAHSATPVNQSINDIFEINSSDGERKPYSYELPITQEFEKQQIKETYFYNDDFKFTWSDSDDYGYNNFWVDKKDASGHLTGTLNKNNLANTGMMVGGELLSNILYQSEFSLSGGSLELYGYSNIAGTDEKIWKLYKNGEQADSKKIEIKGWQLMSATNEVLPNQIHISYDWTNCLICWNKNITPGTYKFYVVVNYLKEKDNSNEEETICYCKSDLITLRITDENDSDIAKRDTYLENKVNLNDNSSNIMKQLRLIDFVKNTNFSLNYEEIDKNTEIKINSFNFNYKHSPSNTTEERVFEIETNEQDKVYKSLNNEINKENGVTDRTSKKLYSVVQKNYEDVKEKTTFGDLKTVLSELENETKSIKTCCIVIGAILIITLALTAIYCTYWTIKLKTERPRLIAVLIFTILIFIILIGLLIAADVKLLSQITNLQNSMKNIGDNKDKNYALIKNIETDVKYFEGKDAKETWEKDGSHDVQVWKSKKYYYESGYKEKKVSADGTIAPSDHEEFLGGKTNADNLKENSKSLIKTYTIVLIFISVVIPIVVTLFILYICKAQKWEDFDYQKNWSNDEKVIKIKGHDKNYYINLRELIDETD